MNNMIRIFKLFKPQKYALLMGFSIALAALGANFLMLSSVAATAGGMLASLALIRMMALLRPIARYAERLITHSAMFRVIADLRLWLFTKLLPLSPARLGFRHSGDLLARLGADMDVLDALYLRVFMPLALFAFMAIVGVVLLFIYGSLSLGFFSLGMFIVLGYSLHKAARQGVAAAQVQPALQSQLKTSILDGIDGLAALVAVGGGHRQAQKIAAATVRLGAQQWREGASRAIMQGMVQLFLGLVVVGFVCLLQPLVVAGEMEAQTALMVVILLLGVGEVIFALPQALLATAKVQGAAERIFEVADLTPAVVEPVHPQPLPLVCPLAFEAVSFAYTQNRPVLSALSFAVPKGGRLLITGSSGAGKSSIFYLLMKFAQPQQGRILWGGRDIADIEGDEIRKQINALSQHTALMAGTVRDNLLLANPEADDVQLWDALEKAGVADVVRGLPALLDEWVGANAALLSGGQARRLALAQLFLRDCPVWLLDEPTEGLDRATAHEVMHRIAQHVMAHNITLLLVTHQPAWGEVIQATENLSLDRSVAFVG